MKATIAFKNIKKVSDKLEPKELYWPQAKATLDEIGRLGVEALKKSAPSGRTHQLRDRITYKVNDIPKPLWVVFKTDATATPKNPGARGGKTKYPFSYPKNLEFSKRSLHQHWMRDGIRATRSRFRSAINKCAARIEADWSGT